MDQVLTLWRLPQPDHWRRPRRSCPLRNPGTLIPHSILGGARDPERPGWERQRDAPKHRNSQPQGKDDRLLEPFPWKRCSKVAEWQLREEECEASSEALCGNL